MSKAIDLLTPENEVFRTYCFCSLILIQKLILMSMCSKESTKRHQSSNKQKKVNRLKNHLFHCIMF